MSEDQTNKTPMTMNGWFLALEPGRQAVLREDRWMLANNAFDAGLKSGMQFTKDMIKNGEKAITDDMIFAAQASYLGDVDGSGRISDEQMKQAIIAALAAMK